MNSEPTTNGSDHLMSDSMTAAEILKKKHQVNADHRPMVEDVIDEEDLEHPPPSMAAKEKSAPSTMPEIGSNPLSEKAAGKRKVESSPSSTSAKTSVSGPPNTQSDEAFPALGGGTKAPAPTQPAMVWGSKKPSAVHTGPNGVNGHAPTSNVPSSRASTPASEILTPTSTNASLPPSQQRGLSMPQHMQLPGRHCERIQFAPSQLLPRNQLKKPLPDVLRNINKASKAKVEMKTGPNGTIVFEGTGPIEATRQALKDLAREVGSKQQVKIPIPTSVRPHVIGRAGTVISAISKRTGARVQVPKGEEGLTPAMDDDDSQTVDVTIEGDAVAAEMARREIESIVNERTSTVNLRLRDVPAELFPFIAGPHNSAVDTLEAGQPIRIQVPQYHTWLDQPPPQTPAPGSFPQFLPNPSQHIRISGERNAAQDAKAAIERRVEELRRQITLSQVPIDRSRHQFILENEKSLHDLLLDTGCAIIMPPASEDTEFLTVTGPQDRIETGLEKVMDLASAMQLSRVDVARQHPNAPLGSQLHAHALSRYLRQRRAIEQIERQHNARIVLPSDEQGSPDWEVYFKEGRNGIRARQDALNLISAHPPQRLRHLEVDPFFHQYIHQHGAPHIRKDYHVHLVPPAPDSPAQHLLLVYEGPLTGELDDYQPPSQKPTARELELFETNLQQAQQHLLSLIQGQEDISAADVEIPPKYHDKVRKFIRRKQDDLPATTIPVQLAFAPTPVANGGLPAPQGPGQLRGPTSAVHSLAEQIVQFLEAEKRDEKERGHVTTFDFPQKHANQLIGKRGENINKLREEFDVDVQVKDGKVVITGPQTKADAAKARIIALGKKLEDEQLHVLRIDPKFHRELVGPKGSQVNRLQERYKVRVQFPRAAPPPGDERSVADDASEADHPRSRRSNQGPDEVYVRGPSRGADAARDELLSLLQWTRDNSHSSTVSVAQRQLPSLIGQGGQELESIQLATGARIDVPSRDTADSSGRVQVQLKGTKKQVEEAKQTIEQRVRIFDDSVTKTIDVDRKYHSTLIGSGGANIRNIVVAAGGSDDRRDLARTVKFPKQDTEDTSIRVEGNAILVDKIIAAIRAFADQKQGQKTETMQIPPDKHRLLIGRGGESRRALESQFNIGLDIPKMSAQGHERSQVKISGQPADIEKARAHIAEMTREQEGETFQVPKRYHHIISDNGQFFRRLRNDHKVTVDHGGEQPPPRMGASKPHSNTSASMPLITDDQANSHSWELLDNAATESPEDGDIPWILRGSNTESIAKARAQLEKALEQAKTRDAQCTGYLILPDPTTYRFIIGQGGSQINSIRKQTGCKITVPRDQVPGSKIEIVGEKGGVEEARDIILDVIQNGAAAGGGGGGRRRE